MSEKLVMMSRDEFISDFNIKTQGKTIEEIALMVWEFTNEVYDKGYNQGYYNPDFDDDSE